MGIFGATHEWVEKGQKTPLRKIGHTYLKIIKLSAVIPYLRNIQKYTNTYTYLKIMKLGT